MRKVRAGVRVRKKWTAIDEDVGQAVVSGDRYTCRASALSWLHLLMASLQSIAGLIASRRLRGATPGQATVCAGLCQGDRQSMLRLSAARRQARCGG